MAERRIAPYGSWSSPITSDLIVAATIGLAEVALDGANVYWLESRPQEGGRSVLMRRTRAGELAEATPPGDKGEDAFSVRTRVHEYGGGAYLVAGGVVYFSNDRDQRLYRADPGALPVAITEEPREIRGLRYADAGIDRARGRIIAVREEHKNREEPPANTLVAIAPDGSSPQRILAQGSDFYAAPRLSPDGATLAWLEWDHPNMPWDGTRLMLGRLAADGAIAERRMVAGGEAESILEPSWSPSGLLYFLSDKSGWWNLYRAEGAGALPIYPLEAEFGRPAWSFRASSYAFASPQLLYCSFQKDGLSQLAAVDLETLRVTKIPTPFSDISSLHADSEAITFRGGSPERLPAIVRLSRSSGEAQILRAASSEDPQVYAGYISRPQPFAFPTARGLAAHALFYPPKSSDFAAPAGELPPLLLRAHGGPTGAATATLDWTVQFWTSRGFAFCDVNYGGSSGYGRAYRERLRGNWGVVDVEDCVHAARHLAAERRVDERRMAIRGGSAGGFTALSALTFHDTFATGASYYGICDLEALAKDTHKFESRYLDGLVGRYPESRERYRERSPLHFADRVKVPVAFFQGSEDSVVPLDQAEAMASALKKKGVPVQYLLFSGEQHGFRRAENIKRALDAELCFYSLFLSGTRLSF
jgi:dipeptidyl aminopeptidase/acylaminoacyl peptidase